MAIDVQISGSVAHIQMSGQFNFQVHRAFKDAYAALLENAAIKEIKVEMSKLDYIDSSALGMLMLLNERAKAAGKSITLLNASGMVMQVLEVANFGRIFNIKQAM